MWQEVHSSVAVYIGYSLGNIGVVLWLWSMYVYIPQNYPTRMRALGTGWTDGVGHLGAWGGVLIAGAVFSLASPSGFIWFVTIPCALLPGVLLAIFGKNQRDRTLEELAQSTLGRRQISSRPALSRGVTGDPEGVTGGPAPTPSPACRP